MKEAAQGNQDRNGDGDASDCVIHTLDHQTGEIVNTGFAALVGTGATPQISSLGKLVFNVPESSATGDLNGDGDIYDSVIHAYDTNTRQAVNLGFGLLTVNIRPFHRGKVSFAVNEGFHGFDLDGDGEASYNDFVICTYDEVTNMAGPVSNPTHPGFSVGSTYTDESDEAIAFAVREAFQGVDFVGTDLNDNGDAQDDVLHFLDLQTGLVTNLMASVSGATQAAGNVVAFLSRENSSPYTDLNNDGDAADSVLFFYDTSARELKNTMLACSSFKLDEQGGCFVALVSEGAQGNTDMNGDGDTSDNIALPGNVRLQDGKLAVELYRGRMMAGDASLNWSPFGVVGGENIVVIRVRETDQGNEDLNGDGNNGDWVTILGIPTFLPDVVPVFFKGPNPEAFSVNILPFAILYTAPVFCDRVVAFTVDEITQGQDLNGDGLVGGAYVFHAHDVVSGVTTNFQLSCSSDVMQYAQCAGPHVAFKAAEQLPGGGDLNGDGDATDFVMQMYDTANKRLVNLRSATPQLSAIYSTSDSVYFEMDEAAQGGRDFNGDGDSSDMVLHVIDFPK